MTTVGERTDETPRSDESKPPRSDESDPYQIRPFRDGDADGYRQLYEDVFDDEASRDWFAWKYRENPFADHVPIFVATADGEVVGARSFFALPLRVGDRTIRSLQPCDTMVAPDHRRRGIFTRLTERALATYRADETRLCFNFPNAKTLPGNLKLGWRVVSPQPVWYRIQDPRALARTVSDRRSVRLGAALGAPVLAGYTKTRATLGRLGRGYVTVERHESVPAERLAALSDRTDRSGIRVPRTERFLEWRYRNPRWAYRTYFLRSNGRDAAAMVVGTRDESELTKTKLLDVLAPPSNRTDAAARFIPDVLDDCRESTLVASLADSVPPDALARYGFLPDDRLPLDRLTATTTLVARPLEDDGWTVDGVPIDDPSSWTLSFADQDRN
ncbi:GNAT family N-acetyltransferase [Halovivax gelatinilyticus]|uniref:GNAT family N-acetyltransferase n=1 Tax=Halovivax gelatinilyticus TaxID=2961597 RepID=UPI0020CA8D02|nr:GNAT family N-acetyltransferase [Halovivax gelatinilyticus]